MEKRAIEAALDAALEANPNVDTGSDETPLWNEPPPSVRELIAQLPLSPALNGLPQSRRPEEPTVCERCPSAVWFASDVSLSCFCRVMQITTWSTKDPNSLLVCDGIIQAAQPQEE